MESVYNYWLADELRFNVFVADNLCIDETWHCERFKCGYWTLYCNDRDGASLHFPGYSYPLQGQRLYVIPAGMTFRTSNSRTVGHFFVHFDVSGLPDLALRTLFNHPLCLPPSPALETLTWQTSAELAPADGTPELWTKPGLLNKHNVAPAVQWRLKAILYEGFASYLKSLPPDQVERCYQLGGVSTQLIPALRYIEECLAERLLNGDLARMCGVSEGHFIRLFRQCLGQTPAQYVLERRVMLAAQRLRFASQTLEEVAEDLGFYDRAHLSRVFKSSHGVSPSAYRRRPPPTSF